MCATRRHAPHGPFRRVASPIPCLGAPETQFPPARCAPCKQTLPLVDGAALHCMPSAFASPRSRARGRLGTRPARARARASPRTPLIAGPDLSTERERRPWQHRLLRWPQQFPAPSSALFLQQWRRQQMSPVCGRSPRSRSPFPFRGSSCHCTLHWQCELRA